MDFVQNFPFFSIMLSMFSGILSSILPAGAAKWLNRMVITIIGGLSFVLLCYLAVTGESYTYMMGHFPAPWGNEIRAGILEAGMAFFFCIVMLLSMLGGSYKLLEDVPEEKQSLYYILVNLLLSSLLALIYTNDIFTAYVFVEINTITACGLIMIRGTGQTIEAAVRYMIMSLLGSGMLLLGICTLYDLTGHLLMSNMKEQVAMLAQTGQYTVPLLVTIGLISVGLAIKSALFPFHAWLPDAYGYSTASSAAILSSLVSKGYIFLLIKLIYRVFGFEVFHDSRIINVLFVFGLMGMIFGSLSAIREKDLFRMIAFSSVAQIGYIFMGIGMGTQAAMAASVFHILSHGATKSLLFISATGLSDASDGSKKFTELTGAAYRAPCAASAFTVGALSMVGVPLFAGFISKLLFAQAAVQNSGKMLPALVVLGISTVLNAMYFMKTVICIFTPAGESAKDRNPVTGKALYVATLVGFVILNLILGVNSQPIVELIRQGLAMFA